jgi:hypothetical protein
LAVKLIGIFGEPRMKSLRLPLTILGASVLWTTALSQANTIDGFFQSKSADIERAAAKAARLGGKVVGWHDSQKIVRVRIPQSRQEEAKKQLSTLGMTHIKWEAAPSGIHDSGSRWALEQRLEQGRAVRKALGKENGPKYMEALKQWVFQRTYPFDRIDLSQANEALRQQREMPAYRPSSDDSRSLTLWERVGPNNLKAPTSRIYFGPFNVGGRINALAYVPNNPSIIFAGTGRGGLWRSNDSGSTWSCLSSDWDSQNINCIHMASSSVIYVGLGDYKGGGLYGGGIMRSTNGGSTWSKVGTGVLDGMGVTSIVTVPGTNGLTVLAANADTWNEGRIFRSTNGGTNWAPVNLMISNTHRWTNFSVGVSGLFGSRAIYVIGRGNGQFRLHRTFDGGATWTAKQVEFAILPKEGFGASVAASQVDPSTVYVMLPGYKKVFVSKDYGDTWTDITSGMTDFTKDGESYNFSQSDYNFHLTTSKVYTVASVFPLTYKWFDVLYAGNIDLQAYSEAWGGWATVGGPTWTHTALTHNDQHSMAIHPTSPDRVLVGNDGGIYSAQLKITSNGPAWTFAQHNDGIGADLFIHADVHSTNPTYLVGGTQDNGIQATANNLQNWRVAVGGDGGYSHIDYGNVNRQFSSNQNLKARMTSDAWATSNSIAFSPSRGEVVPFYGVTELSRRNSSYFFAGTDFLRRYNTSTGSWETRTRLTSPPNYITAIASTTSTDEVFAGTSDGGLFWSEDHGKTFKSITTTNFLGTVSSIGIVPGGSNSLVVTLSTFGSNQVQFCADYKSANPVWTARVGAGTSRLPNAPANSIWRDPSDPLLRWWVGTDIGVFITQNAGNTWLNATVPLGLPNVQVNRLMAGPDSHLYAVTYGRGIWKFKLNQRLMSLALSPGIGKRGGDSVFATLSWTNPSPNPQTFSINRISGPQGVTFPSTLTAKGGATSLFFFIHVKEAQSPGTLLLQVLDQTGARVNRSLKIEDPAPISLTATPSELSPPGEVKLTFSLDSQAVAGLNKFASGSSSPFLPVPATIEVPVGSKSVTQNLSALVPDWDVKAKITVVGFTQEVLLKRPRIKNLYSTQTALVGGTGATASLRIETHQESPYPIDYTITTTNSALSGPASITVPANSRFSPWFTMSAGAVTSTAFGKVTATQYGKSGEFEASESVDIAVAPNGVKSFTISPASVVGGGFVTGTITLEAKPAFLTPVTLSETSPHVSPPTTVYFPQGIDTISFAINTTMPPAGDQVVSITATRVTSKSATLTVKQNGVLSAVPSPATISSGQESTVTVTLGKAAPVGGAVITLSIPAATVITGPSSLVIPAGSTTGTFKVKAKTVTKSTPGYVTATYLTTAKTATITVVP